MGTIDDGNNWHTLFWLFVGLMGNIGGVAAIIGASFIISIPFVVYQKYQAIRTERDNLQWHVERLSRENNELWEKVQKPAE